MASAKMQLTVGIVILRPGDVIFVGTPLRWYRRVVLWLKGRDPWPDRYTVTDVSADGTYFTVEAQ